MTIHELAAGVRTDVAVERIPLTRIDTANTPYQMRLEVGNLRQLRASILAIGQAEPILLRATRGTHQIVDGHRRCAVLTDLQQETVSARVLQLSDDDAWRFAYAANSARDNYRRMDRAYAVWVAHERGSDVEQISTALGVTRRHVNRLLQLMEMPPAILQLVRTGRLTVAHALVMKKYQVRNPERLSVRVEREGLSARALEKELESKTKTASRSRAGQVLQHSDAGFRLKAVAVDDSWTQQERDELHSQLIRALELLTRSSDQKAGALGSGD